MASPSQDNHPDHGACYLENLPILQSQFSGYLGDHHVRGGGGGQGTACKLKGPLDATHIKYHFVMVMKRNWLDQFPV